MTVTNGFFNKWDSLRSLIPKPVSEEVVQEMISLLKDNDLHAPFFKELSDNQDIKWLESLINGGLFLTPPESIIYPDGSIRYSGWPQSNYLVSISEIAPAKVCEIFLTVETQNRFVYQDMIRAAKIMPAEYAATLIDKIAVVVQKLGLFYLLDDLGKIVAKLAIANKVEEALRLAEKSFDIKLLLTSPQSVDNLDYSYLKALNESVIPSLQSLKPQVLLQLLCTWLSQAIEIDRREQSEESKPPEDYSYIWRPAIENHSQNRDYDFHAKLVTLIRDAFESAIRENRILFNDAITILDNQEWNIFNRLKIHLITEFGDQNPELVREVIMNHDNFLSAPLKHEYARLVSKTFDSLNDQDRSQWMEWVERGPSWLTDNEQEESDSEDRKSKIEFWQYHKCHLIREHLAGKWKELHDQMFSKYGSPLLADLVSYSTGAREVASVSPLTIEQLREMGLKKTLTKMESWEPCEKNWYMEGPSLAGLISTFCTYVKEDATTLSNKAPALIGKHARFIRAYLEGLISAVKENKSITLEPVLELCDWVTDKQVDESVEPVTDCGDISEKDWQWIFNTIGSLLKEVCKARIDKNTPQYSIDYRSRFAQIITQLLSKGGKRSSLVNDAETHPQTADWVSIAINSPRGKAMETLFDFARWVATNLVGDISKHKMFPGGYSKLPEIQKILEEQLTRKDADFTERAMFGYHLNFLYWLDRNWLEKNANQIFNLTDVENNPNKAFGWAAWNSFLHAMPPHKEFYRILKNQFRYAVQTAATIDLPSDSREDPFERLSQHLIILYGWGQLGEEQKNALNPDGGLIHRLVCESQQPIRIKAIESAGSSLHQPTDEKIGDDILDCYKQLWEHYWNTVGKDDAKTDKKSGLFGYWFCSGVFDNQWSIEQLEKVANVAPKMHPDSLIVEQLAKICKTDPMRSATIIKLFTEGDDEGWLVDIWKDDAYKVLKIAMNANDKARAIAEETIDILGRRGHLNFGDLLN